MLLVHGSVMAWKEGGNVSSDLGEDKGRKKHTSTEHFLCVPRTQCICSHLPTQKPLQGGSYDPHLTGILHPTPLKQGVHPLLRQPPSLSGQLKPFSILNSEYQPQHTTTQTTCNCCSWSAECLRDVRITRGRHH